MPWCLQVVFYWTLLARHICRIFDQMPHLRPAVLERSTAREDHHISLSVSQLSQIEEIFNLFDTDGGGSIDRSELELALVALGFQRKISNEKKTTKSSATSEMIQDIASDGTVTLEEFRSLMMGEIKGRNPMDNVDAVFTVLSRSEDQSSCGLITVAKLNAACKQYQVPPTIFSGY